MLEVIWSLVSDCQKTPSARDGSVDRASAFTESINPKARVVHQTLQIVLGSVLSVFLSSLTYAETPYQVADMNISVEEVSLRDATILNSTVYLAAVNHSGDLCLYRHKKPELEFSEITKIASRAEFLRIGSINTVDDLLVLEVYLTQGDGNAPMFFVSDGASSHMFIPSDLGYFRSGFKGQILFEKNPWNAPSLVLYNPKLRTSQTLFAATASNEQIEVLSKSGSPLIVFKRLLKAPEKQEIWVSDGTISGTKRLVDISTQDPMALGSTSIREVSAAIALSASEILFTVNAINPVDYNDAGPSDSIKGGAVELWKANVTTKATTFLKGSFLTTYETLHSAKMVAVGTRILAKLHRFDGWTSGNRYEVWSSDGSRIGTKDLVPTTSDNIELIEDASVGSANRLAFILRGSYKKGQSLYATDGLSENMVPLRTVYEFDSYSGLHKIINSQLFFVAKGEANDQFPTLWRSDGTSAGTVPVRKTTDASTIKDPRDLLASDSTLVFTGRDNTLFEISEDPTRARIRGFSLLAGARTNQGSADRLMAAHQGKFLFSAYTGKERGVFLSTGLPGSFSLLEGFPVPYYPFYGDEGPLVTVVGNDVYYLTNDVVSQEAQEFSTYFTATFFRSNLTTSNTVNLGTFGIGGLEQPYTALGTAGNRFLFAGRDSVGWGLYSTDGTVSGMTKIDVDPVLNQHIAGINNRALVEVYEPGSGEYGYTRGIVVTDGTQAGTRKSDVPRFNFDEYFVLNGVAYFLSDSETSDSTSQQELWRTDATGAGTRMIKALGTPPSRYGSWSVKSNFTAYGSQILFFAEDGEERLTLWRSDGTSQGTQSLRVWNDATTSDAFIFVAGSAAYIAVGSSADDAVELWKSDGTAAGTTLLKRISADSNPSLSSYRRGLVGVPVAIGNTLYFTVWDGQASTYAIWKSDGTTAGTRPALDVPAGTFRSLGRKLTSNGESVMFVADDGETGAEQWAFTNKNVADECPSDIRKMLRGVCGCNRKEIDLNGDGVVECDDSSLIKLLPPQSPAPPGVTPPQSPAPPDVARPRISGVSVSAPVLKQVKTSVVVQMQQMPDARYEITYTATPPKKSKLKKVKPKTVTSSKSEYTIKSLKVGTKLTVKYRILIGGEASAHSAARRLTVKAPKKK